jgi:fumarate hydratase subunit beta
MSFLKVEPGALDRFREIEIPLRPGVAATLQAGDLIALTGYLFTGRDQTHRRMMALLDQGKPLPVDLKGQLLYYVGPTPARPGRVIGSAGPTTSYRMDAYTPRLLELGLAATLGKGRRSTRVREAMLRHGAIYLASIAGAGALLSKRIVKAEVVAFADAGPEAMYRFEVERFPAVVINDLAGRDFYEMCGAGTRI